MMNLCCNLETNWLVSNQYYLQLQPLHLCLRYSPVLFPSSIHGQHSLLKLFQSPVLCSYFQMILLYRYVLTHPRIHSLQSTSLTLYINITPHIITLYYSSTFHISQLSIYLYYNLSEGKEHCFSFFETCTNLQ